MLGNAAVLDHETGLVWERDPSLTTATWNSAVPSCLGATTSGRMGWRLPTMAEMRSLIDNGVFPAGSPFLDASANFWTATTRPDATTQALTLNTANPVPNFTAVKATDNRRAWCVRGGIGYDGM